MISPLLVLILVILLVLILAFIIANTFRCGIKRYNGGTKHDIKHATKDENTIQKYSYSIYNGDIGLVYDELKQLLAQYNFHEEPLTKHVHLSIGSASGVDIYGKRNFEVRIINGKKQYLDPLFVNQKSVIKSILGGIKSLHYKNKLYETIKNLIPGGMKYIPKTYTIQEFDTKLKKQSIHGGTKQPLRSGTNQPLEKQYQNKQPLEKQPLEKQHQNKQHQNKQHQNKQHQNKQHQNKQPLEKQHQNKQPLEKQHQNKQPLRSESDAYASGCSESDAYASGCSESDAYASGSSESDAYASGSGSGSSESDAYASGSGSGSGTYILKKINTEQQRGVRVFSTQSEYIQIKKELQINPHNAIIMDYITNPALTIDGKKFHLRMYVLLIIESGIKRCYIHDECWILTAEEKYKKGDWLNKKIHISGAKSTMRNYIFPDDIATSIDDAKFHEFKKTLAFATTFNSSIVYEENDIGYHIYGVDVLMTEDNDFLILEFNGSNMLGHDCVQGIKNTPECDIFKKRFSRDYFSFILNCTALSVFGIKRRAIPYAEVCGYGVLSPFMNVLTGDSRCILVPYTDATTKEIEYANKIYFHNKSITLTELLKICNTDNIFLFLFPKERGQPKQHQNKQPLEKQPLEKQPQNKQPLEKQHQNKQPLKKQPLKKQPLEKQPQNKQHQNKQPLKKQPLEKQPQNKQHQNKQHQNKQHQNKQPLRSESDAYASGSSESDAYASGSGSGYLALDRDNYLTVVVMEEYQNRGIATAMIAQFLEIYAHRHNKDSKIHMINKSIFIEKIAKKLQFTLESDITNGKKISSYYTRPCRIKDVTINKVNNYQLLTYNFIEEHNGFNHDILIQYLNKNMVATRSQFVHLAYTEINSLLHDFSITKASTGSKYSKNFIIQGSELKSSLDIKYKTIEIYKEYLESSKNYKNYRNYGIDIPYLYNGYRIDINLFFFLYVSKNGIKKCYYMNNPIVVKSSILFEDELKSDHILSSSNLNSIHANPLKILFKPSDTEYKWHDTFLNDDNYKDMQHSLDAYIEEIAESIIQSDVVPYSESNSGFTIIAPTIDFIASEENLSKFKPQIRYIYTHIGISAFNNKQYQDAFSKHYYDFLTANIINPHFGLSDNTITPMAQPLKCTVITELHVDVDIISKLHLTFNKSRNKIEIHLFDHSKIGYSKIGHIDLNIDDINIIVLSHIELDTKYRKKNIAVNVLFVLMEILASYYAPLNISLKMAFVKPMFQIAHTLQFHKEHFIPDTKNEKDEEYFTRLCRI